MNEAFKSGTLTGMVQAFGPDPTSVTAPLFVTKETTTDYFEFDVVSGSRHRAAFRLPDSPANIQATKSRSRKKVLLTNVREKKTLKPSTVRLLDAPGQRTPASGEAAMRDELADLDAIVERAWEYIRWKLLTTGGFTLDGDYSLAYSFSLGASSTASPIWTTAASATPLANLIAWKELVQKASGDRAAEVWLTTAGLRYLMGTSEALTLLGEATKDKYAAEGIVPKLMDMDVKIVDGGYTPEGGSFNYWLSTNGTAGNMAIIKTAGAVGEFVNGPALDEDAPAGLRGKFSKSWIEPDPSARWILICQQAIAGLTKNTSVGAFTLW